jgi:hypothetical protein
MVSRFWLTYYDPHRRLLGVLIVDSSGLINARFHAAVERLDQGASLCDGHELDDASAALVPPDAMGRMLSLEEAGNVIRQIERVIQKRASAASAGSVRTRQTVDVKCPTNPKIGAARLSCWPARPKA